MARLLNSASGLSASYVRKSCRRNFILATATLVVGSAGAVDAASTSDHPDIAFTLSSTGVYTITYPYAVDANIQLAEIISAAGTVTECILTAKSATAGTATMQLSKGGTAAAPESGDKITLFFHLKTESDT